MWAVILHGGAKTIEDGEEEANRSGCERALRAGVLVLERGGSSIDAAEAVVRALEDDETFNAGRGSARNEDGEIETCAAMMEGRGFNVGAVAVAKGIVNPVSAARAMLFDEPVLIAGKGATAFAREKGLDVYEPDIRPSSAQPSSGERMHDTVGCVALDEEGRLAVAVSTGGLDGTHAGRVGDSPQPGCGFYCDDRVGGVVFSGDGENIARMTLASRVMHLLDDVSPTEAVETALGHLGAIGGEAGGIVLTPAGEFGWAHNSQHFAVAYASSHGRSPKVFLKKADVAND
jgi:beta-aspartyl-peptidase (threonine type)